MRTRTNTLLLILTALFVAGLAIVAGAVSFAHMQELATHHDQLGWKSYAFPISVDGLEIVASLYMVAQRHAGRATGWIPWIALVVGTAASLAANVAMGGTDPIGKAIAGWPAVSMLVSIKLLFALIDHNKVDQRTDVRDDQRTSPTVPDVPRTARRPGQDETAPSGTVPAERTEDPARSAAVPDVRTSVASDAGRSVPGRTGGLDYRATQVDAGTVAHLIPAARTARSALDREGRSLSRDGLADAMRDDGHGVSNARASLLLKILKAEQGAPAIAPASPQPHPDGLDSCRTKRHRLSS